MQAASLHQTQYMSTVGGGEAIVPVDPVRVLQAVTSARACRQAASRRATIVPRRLSFTRCACRKTRSEQRAAQLLRWRAARGHSAPGPLGGAGRCSLRALQSPVAVQSRSLGRRSQKGGGENLAAPRSRSKFAERVIAREAWYEKVTPKKAPS